MEAHYKELKSQLEEACQKEETLKTEIAVLSAETNNDMNRLYSTHLENEELRKQEVERIVMKNALNKRMTDLLNGVLNNFVDVDDHLIEVLESYAGEKESARRLVLGTFQAFKDIPKMFSDEVMKEKEDIIHAKIAMAKQKLQDAAKEFAELKEKHRLENAKDPSATVVAFITDVKMSIINLNLNGPKH